MIGGAMPLLNPRGSPDNNLLCMNVIQDLVKLALEKLKQRGDDNLQGYQTLPPRTPKTPPASLPSEEW